ncbi:MAG: hydrogenase formation protein HypD [Candidatus Sericytochromatia bacterium]|nr:hydrogenase formation protein HypD [Candidatus Sericytochromatia bacterium]
MKYLDEYRDPAGVRALAEQIAKTVTRPWTLMEVCGGQTHAIVKYGLDQLLPPGVELLHGPGCPVCVTPLEMLDRAHQIAAQAGVLFCTFGDMLRVPGSRQDLRSLKAQGADIRMVYSPLDALALARNNPQREVVFFAVGFETTAPANAMAVYQAEREGLTNFSLLVSHVLVPPALEALLSAPNCQVQGFLAAGHVCTVMGLQAYGPLAEKYRVPIVVTGFEPVDLLKGVWVCLEQLENGQHSVANAYDRVVKSEGNLQAQAMLKQVFEVVPRKWRGLGELPDSGLSLNRNYRHFDATLRFGLEELQVLEPAECLSGEILSGLKKPLECPAFGTRCTPERPLGATMVSTEGACAAYYQYRRVTP